MHARSTGAFIGYASAIRRILRDAGKIPKDMLSQWPGYDQGLYTHMYLSHKYGIDIDVHSNVFLSFGLVGNPDEGVGRAKNLLVRVSDAAKDDPALAHAHDGGPMWVNSRAAQSGGAIPRVPAVIHFNADGKNVFGGRNGVRGAVHSWSQGHQTEEMCGPFIRVHDPTPEELAG